MNKLLCVNPRILYPMTTIESINPNTLEYAVQQVKSGVELSAIRVIDYNGYYIVWEGEYEMLAANIAGKSLVNVEVISFLEQNTWITKEKIEQQLKNVGMNAIYDFEALGGFKYSEYPEIYKGGE